MSEQIKFPPQSPADALINRERIRGATRMIPEGTEADKVSAEQISLCAQDVAAFAERHKISRASIAKATSYSQTTISQFISGQYNGNNGQVALDLEEWMVMEEQRRSRPATTEFTWTNVASKIKSVASYCRDYRTIGLIYGPESSGIGKTTALRAIRDWLGPRACSMATINRVGTTPGELLKEIARAIGAEPSGSCGQLFSRLVEKLKDRAHLLIIDQAHNLRFHRNDEPFHQLTGLYDATGSAQLWCGTADLVNYLEGRRGRKSDSALAQVCSRIFPREDLMAFVGSNGTGGDGEPLISIEQVREMFKRNKLRLTGAAERYICKLANRPDSGCLRLCVQLVQYATFVGLQRKHGSIDVPLLQEAMQMALSLHRTDLLRPEIEQPMRAAKAG